MNGPETGVRYPMDRPRIRLGRHPNCDVLVDSGGSVSRYHAEIAERGDSYFVQDSNSRNGTFLNGRKIEAAERLFDEDQIQICDLVFLFRDDRASAKRTNAGAAFPITAVLVEDADPESSIMSSVEVTSMGRYLHVRATAESKLRAIMELTENLAKSLSVDSVLAPVLDSLFKVFLQADQGFIVLKTKDGRWEPRCTRFRKPSVESVRISRSIVDRVMSRKEAILSADAADDSRFNLSESIANFRIRSFMCVPLIDTEQQVIGALQIDSSDGQARFQDDDVELVVSVASQAAIAIQRARLHDEALQSREMQAELDLARQVQLSLLPESRPLVKGYEFFDFYRPANMIGGDFYDYVMLPDGRLVTLVADVSGHGVAAAMVMAKLAADVRYCVTTIESPGKVVEQINQMLYSQSVEDRFVTMIMLVLHPQDHQLAVVNAGHSSPLLRTTEGKVISLPRDKAGMLLGVMPDATYETLYHPLQPGESVSLFTDGIIEAMRDDGEAYGDDRLACTIAACDDGNVEQLGKSVIDDVSRFIEDGVQSDDICLTCMRRLP